jgi:hypothetical protein
VGAKEVNKARAQAEGEAGGRGGRGKGDKGAKEYAEGKRIGLNYNNRVFISISYLGGNSEV